ncbi:MAG: beta-ketoacyl synthase N-terminal-like domain-containing protein [Myxococcota bacterium]
MTIGDRREGIAIIGMACRFPGAHNLEAFWQNLCAGKESVTFFSRDELLAAGVRAETLEQPGFVPASPVVADADRFDAAFFGYTGREATLMDPQQRLFLEVAWECLEVAGYSPDHVRGSVGVFAGSGGVVSSYLAAYQQRVADLLGPTGSLQHIGNDKDFLSTRVSFKLDLQGPSINVQTACSTSLVAVHLACRSLLDGECDMALAGASTVRVPQINGYVYQSEDILSPDGHCRPFDHRAQGTIFGSGVGAVLLKPLSAALADGDHIFAVIKGSSVNNDGGRKVSYTASSVPGQARAMVEAMELAGIPAETIEYVECHATATAVGDPLELQALTRAFRTGTRRTNFCAVGSVKSNIGHLEQAAGMASLIKTALALQHRKLPPSINFEAPNPKLALAESPFFVQTELTEWAANAEHPRRAALNGLGLGGTNAFVLLEEAPAAAAPEAEVERPLHLLALSARSEEALSESASRFERQLAQLISHSETERVRLADVCFTANVSRSQFKHRLAVSASSLEELRERLAAPSSKDLVRGHGTEKPFVFLFTGQGAQYAGMARQLYETQPTYRSVLDECDQLSRGYNEVSLLDAMFARDGNEELINETGYTQVALFAVEYAMARLLESWGLKPAALLGHSVGEVAAACFAGVMNLEQGIRFISQRGRLMQGLPRTGGMAAVFAEEQVVEELLAPFGDRISIAGANSPLNSVVSGEKDALLELFAELSRREIPFRELVVSHAFHSALMDPILDELEAAAAHVQTRKPNIPLISNLTGAFFESAPDARYFREHARRAVRFAAGIKALRAAGHECFVEVGPGATLLGLGRQSVRDENVQWLPCLGRGKSDWEVLQATLRALYVNGCSIDFESFDRDYQRRRVPLPTYPFERKQFWVKPSEQVGSVSQDAHPLLGTRLRSTLRELQFESYYSLDSLPYLDDHRIFGPAVLPTTAALVSAIAAGQAHFGDEAVQVEGFLYREAMVLPDDGNHLVHLVLTPDTEEAATFKIYAAETAPSAPWIHHIEARIVRTKAEVPAREAPLALLRDRCTRSVPIERYYPAIRAMGLEYGVGFRGIQELWQGNAEALTRVRLPEHLSETDYPLHPALLDACLHIYPALAEAYGDFSVPPADLRRTFLPISMERFVIHAAHAREVWVHARLRAGSDADAMTLDIEMFDEAERPIALMQGLLVRRLTAEAMRPSLQLPTDPFFEQLYQLGWQERPALPAVAKAADAEPGRWLIFADRRGVGRALAEQLKALGEKSHLVYRDATRVSGLGSALLDPDQPTLFHRLIRDYFGVPGVSYRNVVFLWALDAPSGEPSWDEIREANRTIWGSALRIVQALNVVNSVTGAAPRLWLATRDVLGPQPSSNQHVPGAPLRALANAMALRHAELWGGLIDLMASDATTADASALLAEITQSDGEDQVALRHGKRFAPRLARADKPRPEREFSVGADRTQLVVGALGGHGGRVSEWLVACGARHLVLVDRVAPSSETKQLLETLRDRGASIKFVQSDWVGSGEPWLMFEHLRDMPALGGVFCCADRGPEHLLDLVEWKQAAASMEPWLRVVWLLHEHTRQLKLDHFVILTPALDWLGSDTHTADAACASFFESVSELRRGQGLPATTFSYGPWLGDNDAESNELGSSPLEPDQVFESLEYVLLNELVSAAVARMDWQRLNSQFKAGMPALYSATHNASARRRRAPKVGQDPRVLLRSIQEAAEGERRDVVLRIVRTIVTDVLGAEEPVDVGVPLLDFGLDSLISVNLVNRLEPALGIKVPLAKLIQGASVERLVDELLPVLNGAATQAA